MAKYEFDIEIAKHATDKRQTLASRIDLALAINGCRITHGTYTVTIERKTTKQLRAEAAATTPPEAPEAADTVEETP